VQVEARMSGHHRGDVREHGAGKGRERGDAQRPGDLLGPGVQVGLSALELSQKRVGVRDERAPRIGQREPPALTFEQDNARFTLERRKLLGDGRRREAERLGGRGDGPTLGELTQDSEAFDVQRHMKHSLRVRQEEIAGTERSLPAACCDAR
jgi:hypothetical protein